MDKKTFEEEVRNDAPAEAQPEWTPLITVLINKTGAIKVESRVLHDKAACYGLLEVARDAIQDAHRSGVQKKHSFLDGLRRGGVK